MGTQAKLGSATLKVGTVRDSPQTEAIIVVRDSGWLLVGKQTVVD